MTMNRNKIILISLVTLGIFAIAPEAYANFAAPYVLKGKLFESQMLLICKMLCGVGLIYCLVDFLLCKLGDRHLNWGKLVTILVISVSLGSLGIIKNFFGLGA